MAGILPAVFATVIISSLGGTQMIEQLSITSSSSLSDRSHIAANPNTDLSRR
jgi:hypothetical protein